MINEHLALQLLFHRVSLRWVIAEATAALSEPPGDVGTMEPPALS